MTARGYIRPSWAARKIGGRMARLFKPSVVCLLSVPGRTSGTWRSTPVVVLEHDGQRYLMGAYGHTEWSRNLRAARRGRLTSKSRVEELTVEEVPADQVTPLIEAYLEKFEKLPTVGSTFRSLPDPADHPTFRITSTPTSARTSPRPTPVKVHGVPNAAVVVRLWSQGHRQCSRVTPRVKAPF